MEKSISITEISKSLIAFRQVVNKVKKDATNPFFKSKYASLSNILEAISDPLIVSGLTFCQFPEGDNGLTTILMHGDSGEYLQATYQMKPVKDDPQGRGSSITYQRRYALAAVLGLNIDDDDDANAASHSVDIKDDKPWLNETDPKFPAIKEKIKSGKATIEQVREHYKISTSVLEKLKK